MTTETGYAYSETPGRLRWIEREGQRVLQQLFNRIPVAWSRGYIPPEAYSSEWRDVPTESTE